MAEIRREENIVSSGLSTAALAHADEPVQQETDNRDDRVDGRADGYLRNDSNTNRMSAESRVVSESDEQTALFLLMKRIVCEANGIQSRWASSMSRGRRWRKRTRWSRAQ